MSYLSSFLRKLRDKFKGSNFLSYGILQACRRCVYQKHYEPILIISRDRGVRLIVNLDGKTYVRKGECIGFRECGKCFEAVLDSSKFLCTWERI